MASPVVSLTCAFRYYGICSVAFYLKRAYVAVPLVLAPETLVKTFPNDQCTFYELFNVLQVINKPADDYVVRSCGYA